MTRSPAECSARVDRWRKQQQSIRFLQEMREWTPSNEKDGLQSSHMTIAGRVYCVNRPPPGKVEEIIDPDTGALVQYSHFTIHHSSIFSIDRASRRQYGSEHNGLRFAEACRKFAADTGYKPVNGLDISYRHLPRPKEPKPEVVEILGYVFEFAPTPVRGVWCEPVDFEAAAAELTNQPVGVSSSGFET